MNDTFLSVRSFGIAALIAGGAFTVVACSDDENPSPSKPPPIGTGGQDGDASAGGRTGSGGGASTGGGKTGSGGNNSGDGGNNGDGGSDPGDGGGSGGASSGGQGTILDGGGCQEDDSTDCYECPINGNNVSFLNRCELSPGVPTSIAFPNGTRIQRSDWQPGQALPTP